MNLKELSFPLRIYWDLTPASRKPVPDIKTICQGIIEIKTLILDLTDNGNSLSAACIEILERLKNESISLTLTIAHPVLESAAFALLSRLGVKELLIDLSKEDSFRSFGDVVRQYKNENMALGVSFTACEENCRNVSDIVSFCLDNGITRLVFPMQRLTSEGDCSYIDPEERKALSTKLKEMKMDKMRLTIHDPLLWRVFYPDVAFPGAGCQAANSMAYISPEAKVYPCPSMPLALGDLKEKTLKAVLSSIRKKEVRRSLLDPPMGCKDCGELKMCMGGCRGRTFALTGSLDLRDPACG